MDEPRKQPEGASRQAVGALIGALAGFGIAAKQIFADFGEAGQIPWVQCVTATMIGGVVGLILASMFGGGDAENPSPPPVNAEPQKNGQVTPSDNGHPERKA